MCIRDRRPVVGGHDYPHRHAGDRPGDPPGRPVMLRHEPPSSPGRPSTDGFVWTRESWGTALRCASLTEVADHFFTTRQLRLRGASESDDWAHVASTIGVPPGRLLLSLIHISEPTRLGMISYA